MKKKWWHDSKSSTALFSFILACFAITIGFGALYAGSHYLTKPTASAPALAVADFPSRLLIPKISLDAIIQTVGTTTSGRMGIPDNFTDVAWYKFGPKPGERGSANISGHLDTATDANAVFVHLDELKAGDEIHVIDIAGHKMRFKVTDVEVYDEANAPLEKIFDMTGTTARLNLITCDGIWDQGTKNYDKRLVVYSERVLD